MKTIHINKKKYSIPESWDELTQKQLLQVVEVLFLKGYKAEQMLLKLLQAITGASTAEFFKWKYLFDAAKDDAETPDEFFYLLYFLLRPDFEYSKNRLPFFRFGKETYYGPADYMDNLLMKEFTHTENLFIQWWDSEKKDEEALNRLCAILYRPMVPGYDVAVNEAGDARVAFNYYRCLYMAAHVVRYWPMKVRLAIATWYNGCRRALIERYPAPFEGQGDPALFGMVDTMLSVAESGVFGNLKDVEDQPVYLVMMQLTKVMADAKKMEAASKA